MADQDPPIEPLRRVDPSEPDEPGLGRLERLDPDAEDMTAAASVGAAEPPTKGSGSPVRGGLAMAVTLATLLSLSSIAAIGGLVAISMRSVPPGSLEAVTPVDGGIPLTTIRVGESAQGVVEEEPNRDRPEVGTEGDDSAVEFTPVPPVPVAPAPANGGAGKGGDDQQGGAGSDGGQKGTGGVWCDAREGAACDATPGGTVLVPAGESEGYVGDEEDEYQDDDDWDEEDLDGSSGGSSSTSSSGSRPGRGR